MVLAAIPVLGLHIGQSGVATLPGSPALQAGLPGRRQGTFQARTPTRSEIVTQGSSHTDLKHLDLGQAARGDPGR